MMTTSSSWRAFDDAEAVRPEGLATRAAAAVEGLRTRKAPLHPARRPRAPGMIGDSQAMAEVYALADTPEFR